VILLASQLAEPSYPTAVIAASETKTDTPITVNNQISLRQSIRRTGPDELLHTINRVAVLLRIPGFESREAVIAETGGDQNKRVPRPHLSFVLLWPVGEKKDQC